MRLLVTGSSGYLASLVLPRLAALPGVERLVGLDVRPPRGAPGRLEHRAGSVLDPGLAGLLSAERIDTVLHLAWVFNPTHDREQMRRVDVEGTRNVVESAARSGVRHLVHLGSTTGYGARPTNPPRLDEASPTPPGQEFPYASDKAEAERLLDELEPRHPGLGITRVRPCIVLGRRTDNFVRAILDLPVLLRIAGHDPPLQFLHEDDLAAALAAIVERRPRGAFNVVPPDAVRMSELGGLLGKPTLVLPESVARAAVGLLWSVRLLGVPPSYLDFVMWPWIADGRRARSELGIELAHGSREAVRALRRR